MARVEYRYHNGVNINFFLALKSGKIYEGGSQDLHNLYGGSKYYTSRSGISGAGYLDPQGPHDLIELGYYRAGITHLSEFQPKKVPGDWNVMLPCDTATAPAVAWKQDGNTKKIVFWKKNDGETLKSFLKDENCLENFQTKDAIYKYINIAGETCEYKASIFIDGSIGWCRYPFQPSNLPYGVDAFISLAFGMPDDALKADTLNEISYIHRKMNIFKGEADPDSRGGRNSQGSRRGVTRDKVEISDNVRKAHYKVGRLGLFIHQIGEVFLEEPQTNFGWVTQKVGHLETAYRRTKKEEIYAIIQVDPGAINEKYSGMQNEHLEKCYSLIEWFGDEPETHFIEMLEELKGKLEVLYEAYLQNIESERLRDLAIETEKEEVYKILENNPDYKFSKKDALVMGYSEQEIERFLKKFSIIDPYQTGQELICNDLHEMLSCQDFRWFIKQRIKIGDGEIAVQIVVSEEEEA